jgi:hypothetical protein
MNEKLIENCPLCRCCGEPMKLVRAFPPFAGTPEIRVFYCEACKHSETAVLEEAA